MSGLEAVEVNFVDVLKNKDFRVDTQFYTTQLKRNSTLQYRKIGDCLARSQYGISIEMNEEGIGYPIYRMNEIQNMLCDLYVDKAAQITQEEFEIFKLNAGDVLFNRTNSYEFVGRTGVYYPNAHNELKVFASYLVRFVPDSSKINSEYLATFLSCKYGAQDIKRRARQSINQTNVNPEEVKEIEIPLLCNTLQNKIQQYFKSAHALRVDADKSYKNAEQLLLTELGLTNFIPSTKPVSVKSFADSFGASGRLDAEYYQPKYEDVLAIVSNSKNDLLSNLVTIKKSIEPGSSEYMDEGIPFVRVSDISKFGVTNPEIHLSRVPFANMGLQPTEDTILFTKDGTVGIAYKAEKDMDIVTSGAILHLAIKDKSKLLPDYLTLVLNSMIVQMQAERDTGGSIIIHWQPSDIGNVVIPVLDKIKQEKLAEMVQKSFALRQQAEKLLDMAKRATEIAIEDGENKAIEFLEETKNG